MKYKPLIALLTPLLMLTSVSSFAAPCAFDSAKDCTLQRDILNDRGPNGLRYYAPTNYDHRMSGEIELYKSYLVVPNPSTSPPGQLNLLLNNTNGNWTAGEIMTRANLNAAPFFAPGPSNRWTTQEIKHGYLEVVVKMPKCEKSSDGLCEAGTAPNEYNRGFWPAIWLMPTMDANWPLNGEIDISEAYLRTTNFNVSTGALHFNGNDPRCSNNDCVFTGYSLTRATTPTPLWTQYHTWGFEWQPDPQSANGGQILTGYFDNVRIWGPLRTDTLPGDGPNAMRRGFNDPNGGWYLIVNFAVGGGYAGPPNSKVTASTMYLQSAKAYTVGAGSTPTPPNPPTSSCLAPSDIKSMYSIDKKQATLAWLPPTGTSQAVANYQIGDWRHRIMWKGASPTIRVFQDQTLPGTNGKFTYYLSSQCQGGATSPEVQVDVVIN